MSPRLPPPDADLIERREILDSAGIARTLRRIASELVERGGPVDSPLYLVGIRTGGAHLAARLVDLMRAHDDTARPVLGAVDISLYRDDVFRGLPKPEIGPTDLPESIDGRVVVLVDDVLFTGRSVRAAMDALSDFGRPSAIRLAVLVDRAGRELPIQPDFVGVKLATVPRDHRVNVRLKETDGEDRILVERRV